MDRDESLMSVEDIHRYVDGELVGSERARFEEAISKSADLRRTVEDAFRMNGMLRVAFAQEAVLSRDTTDVLERDRARGKPSNDFRKIHGLSVTSLAASFFLMIATGLGGFVVGGYNEVSNQSHSITALQERQGLLIQQALEHNLSGEAVAWHESDYGVSVTPIHTYRRADGSYCREYRKDIILGQVTLQEHGLACRNDDAKWVSPAEDPTT